jgi:hypothetical protein
MRRPSNLLTQEATMNWDSPRTPTARTRLARLRRELNDVADQAREATAAAVGRSVAGAVAGALLAALSPAGRQDPHSQRPCRSYSDGFASSRERDGRAWGQDDRQGWHDPYAQDYDDDPGYGGEPGFEDVPPHVEARGGRSSLALAFGLRAAAWWLGRPRRTSVLAALAVGALAALAGHALLAHNDDDEDSNNL